jgi:hypothetical protein
VEIGWPMGTGASKCNLLTSSLQNTPSVGICAEQPLSAILLEQLKSLTMLTTNGLAKNKPDSIREEIWIEIPAQSPTIPAAAETETQLTLGEATVEWSRWTRRNGSSTFDDCDDGLFSANSCESVRSLLPLGQLPLISSPIAIQADLLPSNSPTNNNNNNMDDDEWGTIPQVGQPFAVRFTLWNSCAAGTETLLPVQIAFEQVDGLIFSGTKEVDTEMGNAQFWENFPNFPVLSDSSPRRRSPLLRSDFCATLPGAIGLPKASHQMHQHAARPPNRGFEQRRVGTAEQANCVARLQRIAREHFCDGKFANKVCNYVFLCGKM